MYDCYNLETGPFAAVRTGVTFMAIPIEPFIFSFLNRKACCGFVSPLTTDLKVASAQHRRVLTELVAHLEL